MKIKNEIKILGITEIISKNEFFDYESKYSGLSEEITPANISVDNSFEISNISKSLYKKLNLKGFCRFDFILPENNPAVLIEINTVPGMTLESIIPKQLKKINLSLEEFTNLLAEEVLENGKNRNFPGIF
jgi:D-alanine-D-alanine ligase